MQLQFMGLVTTVSLKSGAQSQISQGSLQLQRQHLADGQKHRDTCWRASERLSGPLPYSRENPVLTHFTQETIALQLCDPGEFTRHLEACFPPHSGGTNDPICKVTDKSCARLSLGKAHCSTSGAAAAAALTAPTRSGRTGQQALSHVQPPSLLL